MEDVVEVENTEPTEAEIKNPYISGTMPNGETFEKLVVVAADIVCASNPTGAFERGQLIETSLGPGIIVDFCERAVNERKNNGRTHIDIATDWYN